MLVEELATLFFEEQSKRVTVQTVDEMGHRVLLTNVLDRWNDAARLISILARQPVGGSLLYHYHHPDRFLFHFKDIRRIPLDMPWWNAEPFINLDYMLSNCSL